MKEKNRRANSLLKGMYIPSRYYQCSIDLLSLKKLDGPFNYGETGEKCLSSLMTVFTKENNVTLETIPYINLTPFRLIPGKHILCSVLIIITYSK